MTSPAAGWFSDPQAPHLLRWWDGMQWTHHVQPHPAAAAQGLAHGAAGEQQHGAGHHQATADHQQDSAGLQAAAGFQQASGHQPVATGHHAALGFQAASAVQAASGYQPGAAGYQAGSTIGGLPASGGAAAALDLPASGSASLMETNPRSLTAIGISTLYLFIAIATGVVLMGIVPALFTFRAFESRERLAPAALVAAVVAIGFAVTHTQVT